MNSRTYRGAYCVGMRLVLVSRPGGLVRTNLRADSQWEGECG
jgi:hypothetical protein